MSDKTANSAPASDSVGELRVVGSGMQLGRDISQRALSTIRSADRVYAAVNEFTLSWLKTECDDLVALTKHYADGKDRRQTYRDMEQDLISAVQSGLKVCAVFYGHPGVFADVPHNAIRKLREQGYAATMEPGISADACLYADLGIDPGGVGTQAFEATQFLVYQRRIDPSATLILWQIALTGDLSCTLYSTTEERLGILVDKLLEDYREETQVILYEAAIVATQPVRAETMPLRALPGAQLKEHTTLVILPDRALEPDQKTLQRLGYSLADLA